MLKYWLLYWYMRTCWLWWGFRIGLKMEEFMQSGVQVTKWFHVGPITMHLGRDWRPLNGVQRNVMNVFKLHVQHRWSQAGIEKIVIARLEAYARGAGMSAIILHSDRIAEHGNGYWQDDRGQWIKRVTP